MSIANSFVYNPNQQYLFKRSYAVNIGQLGQTAGLQYGTIGLHPAPLRIKFDIDKNMVGSSNKSKIELYNLSQQSRQGIKKGYVIQLLAGYNGLISQLFLGNVLPNGLTSTRNGPDIVTSMECGDGESAITFSRLDKTYPAGTTLVQILSDVAVAMSLITSYNPVGVNAGIVLGIPNLVYNNGYVAHGPCNELLNVLLKPQGLEWSVQNGNLNITPIGKYNGQSAIVVSSETGMIGTPSSNDQFTQFTSLLNPRIIPGCLVQLQSENTTLNGFYTVRRCHYEGDTHDTKWQVACEAVLQPGVSQNLPAAQGFDFNTAVV